MAEIWGESMGVDDEAVGSRSDSGTSCGSRTWIFIHCFHPPDWRSVRHVKAMGRNGWVALAARWMPRLLFLATCSSKWRKKPLLSMPFHLITCASLKGQLRCGPPQLSVPSLPTRANESSFALSSQTPYMPSTQAFNSSIKMIYGPICPLHLSENLSREGWFLILHTSQGHLGQC